MTPTPDAESTAAPDSHLAMRVQMMPRDMNVQGTIFGGVILSLIDQAGFYEARLHGLHRWVTVSMNGVVFQRPVWSGDIVSLYTQTTATGRSSVTIDVQVFAERFTSGDTVEVTNATLTMVSVDAEGHSIPFDSPPTTVESGSP